jgi:hypothetical protein
VARSREPNLKAPEATALELELSLPIRRPSLLFQRCAGLLLAALRVRRAGCPVQVRKLREAGWAGGGEGRDLCAV